MNFDRLRVIADLANVGKKQEAVLATSIPEVPGSFLEFCMQLGDTDITEFRYRCNRDPVDRANVMYSITVRDSQELQTIKENLASAGLDTVDCTDDELVVMHLKALAGGLGCLLQKERIFSFEFPERPGALLKFLELICPRFNITLFHYRNEGTWGVERVFD